MYKTTINYTYTFENIKKILLENVRNNSYFEIFIIISNATQKYSSILAPPKLDKYLSGWEERYQSFVLFFHIPIVSTKLS